MAFAWFWDILAEPKDKLSIDFNNVAQRLRDGAVARDRSRRTEAAIRDDRGKVMGKACRIIAAVGGVRTANAIATT